MLYNSGEALLYFALNVQHALRQVPVSHPGQWECLGTIYNLLLSCCVGDNRLSKSLY